jgi:Tfp pilus assembly protein PilE
LRQDLEQQLSQARAVLVAEAGRLERHFAATQEQERRHGAEAAERLQKVGTQDPHLRPTP